MTSFKATLIPLFLAACISVPTLANAAAGSILEPLYMSGADRSGQINTGTEANGYFDVAVSGDYVYVTTTAGNTDCGSLETKAGCEIHIYDVSNPVTPVFAAGIDISGAINSGNVNDYFNFVMVHDDYLYASKTGYSFTDCSSAFSKIGCELHIYDVSDPTAPVFVAGIDASGGINSGTSATFINKMAVTGSYLYVLKERSVTDCSNANKVGCELQIYDITDPTAPVYVAGIDASGALNSGTGYSTFTEIAIDGDTLYIGKGEYSSTACASNNVQTCEVHIYDITDPAAPVLLRAIDGSGNIESGSGGANVRGLAVVDDVLYVASTGNSTDCSTSGNKVGCELKLYDVTDPANPSLILALDSSGTENAGTGNGGFISLAKGEDVLFLGRDGTTSLTCSHPTNKTGCDITIYDVSTPAAPTFLVGIDASSQVATGTKVRSTEGLAATDEYLYAVSHGGGVTCDFEDNRAGCDLHIYQIGEPDAPTIDLTTPAAAAVVVEGAFAATVDWGLASECEYSYDNADWDTVDCDEDGTDILAPSSTGAATLYIRASRFNSAYATENAAFTYQNPVSEEETTGRTSSRKGSSVRTQVSNLISMGNTARAQELMQEWGHLFTPSSDQSAPATGVSVRDLEFGLSGDDVRALQEMLIRLGYDIPAGATGYFAHQTQAALAKYQADNGVVPAVGYFGPITRGQMTGANVSGTWW